MPQPCARMDKKWMSKKKTINTKKLKKNIQKIPKKWRDSKKINKSYRQLCRRKNRK